MEKARIFSQAGRTMKADAAFSLSRTAMMDRPTPLSRNRLITRSTMPRTTSTT